MHKYSAFFETLHDERTPTGKLGRGTHYSVLRAVVFSDSMGKPLTAAQFADFAIIWDEDHDERVIEPIEKFYWGWKRFRKAGRARTRFGADHKRGGRGSSGASSPVPPWRRATLSKTKDELLLAIDAGK